MDCGEIPMATACGRMGRQGAGVRLARCQPLAEFGNAPKNKMKFFYFDD
jgi:hypothetical protein